MLRAAAMCALYMFIINSLLYWHGNKSQVPLKLHKRIQKNGTKKEDALLTSAAIKANVFKPPKNPTPTQTINMNPDKIRIVDSRATNRKCDHPGVVGENDSCTMKQKYDKIKIKIKLENLYLTD